MLVEVRIQEYYIFLISNSRHQKVDSQGEYMAVLKTGNVARRISFS
jgi:hypothetical protein